MSCNQVMTRISTPVKNGCLYPSVANVSARCMSQDQRPKSESGRVPKLGMVNDAVSSGRQPNIANLKRGTGYRSSFSGMVATVFGASGCVGRGVVNRFGKIGSQIILPYRGEHYEMMQLKVSGDLGQILFMPFHLRDEESIRKSMKYSNVVVNLIGREFETLNFSYNDVNVEGPRRLARIARESGVKRFIHVSNLAAKENPDKVFLPKGSEYLKTKWRGEQAVLEEFPDATIIKSVDVYGPFDWFLTVYNSPWRAHRTTTIPLWKSGNATIKQPLFVSDLVSGIMEAVNNPYLAGKIIEAYGPERFLLSDLVDWMYDVMDKYNANWGYRRVDMRIYVTPMIKAFIASKSILGKRYWRAPSLDKLERMHLSDTPTGGLNLADIGVEAFSVREKMPSDLEMYNPFRFHQHEKTNPRRPVMPLVPLSRFEENNLELDQSIISSIWDHLKPVKY